MRKFQVRRVNSVHNSSAVPALGALRFRVTGPKQVDLLCEPEAAYSGLTGRGLTR